MGFGAHRFGQGGAGGEAGQEGGEEWEEGAATPSEQRAALSEALRLGVSVVEVSGAEPRALHALRGALTPSQPHPQGPPRILLRLAPGPPSSIHAQISEALRSLGRAQVDVVLLAVPPSPPPSWRSASLLLLRDELRAGRVLELGLSLSDPSQGVDQEEGVRVVSLPGNLLEAGPWAPLRAHLRAHGVWLLHHRPLRAFPATRRLELGGATTPPTATPPASLGQQVQARLERALYLEEAYPGREEAVRMRAPWLPPADLFQPAHILLHHLHGGQLDHHTLPLLARHHIWPALRPALALIEERAGGEGLGRWGHDYGRALEDVLTALTLLLATNRCQALTRLHHRLGARLGGGDLADMALRGAAEGVHTVLLGAHRAEHWRGAAQALSQPLGREEAAWARSEAEVWWAEEVALEQRRGRREEPLKTAPLIPPQ